MKRMFGIAFVYCCSCGAMDICVNREYTQSQKAKFNSLCLKIDFDCIGRNIANMQSRQSDDAKEQLRNNLICIRSFIDDVSAVNEDTDIELYNDFYTVACGYRNIIVDLLSSS
ncbi:MAG: hypothetical protein LBC04_03485 [Holosporaceae bacterium]|nr:hypothetical protein [Holosporaceae bacterium]